LLPDTDLDTVVESTERAASPADTPEKSAAVAPTAGAQVPKGFAPGWEEKLADEFGKQYMSELKTFLTRRKAADVVIYPHSSNWFRALCLTAFDDVRVVILGQDPYHGPGQAHGLSFSVPDGVATPPSLQNIYKEIHSDLGIPAARSGFLESWAAQGVLLLNSVLTVEQGNANSPQGRGWEQFTDRIIQVLSDDADKLVFLLWGSYAQKKGQIIDRSRHCVLKAPHPSPLSAHRGFMGCKHFSAANQYLKESGRGEIDWSIKA